MTFAIIGIFFAGILFGILALVEAKAAARLGQPNGTALVIAVIDIVLPALLIAVFLLFPAILMALFAFIGIASH